MGGSEQVGFRYGEDADFGVNDGDSDRPAHPLDGHLAAASRRSPDGCHDGPILLCCASADTTTSSVPLRRSYCILAKKSTT